ncbi:MAG: DUF1549 domain-containing protein [Acidobacteria bacterium]|nr:DUF1549 domain-containing protein [Acidobacteriota bacterium]
MDDFQSDKSANAYEKVVDRLLASTRFGERMAFRWLDAARYADTNGYQIDGDRYMWRWRDWVIESFNQNKPYDKFVVDQLAGDLMPGATIEQRLARLSTATIGSMPRAESCRKNIELSM